MSDSIALRSQSLLGFRRGLALLCILDCLQRLPDAGLFLSDLGILPRFRAHLLLIDTNNISLFMLSGRPLVMGLFLLLTMGLAAAVVWGRSERWLRVALWAMMASVQMRNPLLGDAADDLLRLLLFWDMFLPDQPEPQSRQLTLATVGLQTQMSLTLLICAWLFSRPSYSALALGWGAPTLAVAPPWFGGVEASVLVLAALGLWWRGGRLVCFPLVMLIAVLRGLFFHPVFPLVLAVGYTAFNEYGSKADAATEKTAPTRTGSLLWAAVLLLTLGVNAIALGWAVPLSGTVAGASQVLRLQQDWSQVYPLPADAISSVAMRVDGADQPWFTLSVGEGRRRALLGHRLSENARVAGTALEWMAKRRQVAGWVSLWVSERQADTSPRLGLSRHRLIDRSFVAGAPGR